MSVQPLFTPVRRGDLDLPNRILMAPLTRMRSGSIDHVPSALQAEYYAAPRRKPTVAPWPMSTDEIGQTVADYARAAHNAVEAGFDWRADPRQLFLFAGPVPEPGEIENRAARCTRAVPRLPMTRRCR